MWWGSVDHLRQPATSKMSCGGVPLTICDSQHIPTDSNRFQHIPTYSNIFQHIPTYSNIFQQIPTNSNIFQQIPTYSNKFQHIPACVDSLDTSGNLALMQGRRSYRRGFGRGSAAHEQRPLVWIHENEPPKTDRPKYITFYYVSIKKR